MYHSLKVVTPKLHIVHKNIRIFNGSELLIENSVTRVTGKPCDAEQLPA